MFFKKKTETMDSLMTDCSKGYDDFRWSYTKAHYREHFEFKVELKENFKYIFQEIANHRFKSQERTIALLKHMKAQLEFINKHPFSVDDLDMMKFLDANYPYQEKVQEVLKNLSSEEIIDYPKKVKP